MSGEKICTESVERQKQTTNQAEQLELRVGGLHEVITALQDRLSNISRTQPDDDKPEDEKVSETLCELAAHVRNGSDSVQRAIKRIEDITNCLEN